MTRAELEKEYTTVGTYIRSPGKFEGESIWAPYFWNAVLNGEGDHEDIDGRLCSRVDIVADDLREFPELKGAKAVRLSEDDNGFVYCEILL